jgi:guanine nucleotide-binding protein subunit alpha
MGCCQSNEVHDGKARNEEIDNQLKRDKLNMRNEVKMLLLGKKISSSIFVLYPWFF